MSYSFRMREAFHGVWLSRVIIPAIPFLFQAILHTRVNAHLARDLHNIRHGIGFDRKMKSGLKNNVFGKTKEGAKQHTEISVTHETEAILGVTCVVVRDKVFLNGQLAEDTTDWFAQGDISPWLEARGFPISR